MSPPIFLDAAFSFQQAVLAEIYRALCHSHGEAFATYFMDECRDSVMQAARTRMCGQSEAGLLREAARLKGQNFNYIHDGQKNPA
jgi:hypothetical protein